MVINIKVHNEAVASLFSPSLFILQSRLLSRSIAPAVRIDGRVCVCESLIKWPPCEAGGQLMELHIRALLAWEYEA